MKATPGNQHRALEFVRLYMRTATLSYGGYSCGRSQLQTLSQKLVISDILISASESYKALKADKFI